MRRRQPAEPLPSGDVPVELLVGRLTEVWAEDGATYGAVISAWGNYSRARFAWEAEQKLSVRDVCRLLPGPSSPWSFATLVAAGRGDEARERLTRHGVRLDQLDQLRAAAQRRIANAGP